MFGLRTLKPKKNFKKTKNLKTCPKDLGFSSPGSSLLPVLGCGTCCRLRCVWRIAFSVSVEGKFVWLRLRLIVMHLFSIAVYKFLTYLLAYIYRRTVLRVRIKLI